MGASAVRTPYRPIVTKRFGPPAPEPFGRYRTTKDLCPLASIRTPMAAQLSIPDEVGYQLRLGLVDCPLSNFAMARPTSAPHILVNGTNHVSDHIVSTVAGNRQAFGEKQGMENSIISCVYGPM